MRKVVKLPIRSQQGEVSRTVPPMIREVKVIVPIGITL